MPKVLNKYKDKRTPGAVYIGRPSLWGNPFTIGQDGTREEVIAKYEAFLGKFPDLMEKVREELKDRDLMCFCAPKPCHGDVLLKIANEEK